jgi:hypothetical protein
MLTCPGLFNFLDLITAIISREVKKWGGGGRELLIMHFSLLPYYFVSLRSKYSPAHTQSRLFPQGLILGTIYKSEFLLSRIAF